MNFDLFRETDSTEAVRARMAAGVPLLVGFGGGVNSMAALILLRDLGMRPELITFADTGGEHDETYAYFALARAWLKRNDFPPLTLVKNESPIAGDASLEASCLRLKTLPSRAFGSGACAHKWKIEPQEKFLNNWPRTRAVWASGEKPTKLLGYDGGEDHRVEIQSDRKLLYWYPLYERGIDRHGCEALITRERLPIPPKSACWFCPSSTSVEVIELSRRRPDLFARALTMERNARDAGNLTVIRGLGREWSWEELYDADAELRAKYAALAEQARESSVRSELDARFREQPVESCLMCVDQSEAA